jgi:hypothetical protein
LKTKELLLSAVCAVLLASTNANAALVDAVSVIVDNEPITVYEIYILSKQYNISTKEALDLLVRQKLELSQINTMNIQVDDFTLNQQINDIASKNNMSLQSFYNALAAEGISKETYRSELKQKLQRDKLYQYVLSSRFQNVNEDEALLYYNKNPNEFVRFQSFDVVKFESKSAQNLEYIDVSSNENIETIESMGADPRVISALTQSSVGSQTPVIQTREGFVRYVVRSKNGKGVIPFEQVKNMIISKVSSSNENTLLKEYFETLKSRATITIIRLP